MSGSSEEARRLEKLDLIEAAAMYLRTAPKPPLTLLLRLYDVRRLDQMTIDQLKDFIRRGKNNVLWKS